MHDEKATVVGVYHDDVLVQAHSEQMAVERCNLDDARRAGQVREVTWSVLITAAYNGEDIRTELLCEHCFGDIE